MIDVDVKKANITIFFYFSKLLYTFLESLDTSKNYIVPVTRFDIFIVTIFQKW